MKAKLFLIEHGIHLYFILGLSRVFCATVMVTEIGCRCITVACVATQWDKIPEIVQKYHLTFFWLFCEVKIMFSKKATKIDEIFTVK